MLGKALLQYVGEAYELGLLIAGAARTVPLRARTTVARKRIFNRQGIFCELECSQVKINRYSCYSAELF